MNTILFGNGFNRLNNVDSWENLVHVIDDSNDNCKVPNTLQYEGKVLSVPFEIYANLRSSDGLLLVSSDNKILTARAKSEIVIKQAIANQMQTYTSNDLFGNLLCLNVEHFLTTNYDNVADNVFLNMDFNEEKSERDKSESSFSIHRKKCYTKNHEKKYLWKIHGELSNLKSIMLGYNHYCNYVGQIKTYITGNYNYAKNLGKVPIPKIEDRLPITSNNIVSWIDLFFCSDIFIVGLGLYYDEIDLWWLLTLRKRFKQKLGRSFVHNKIIFYGEPYPGMKSMLEHLDVEVVSSAKRKYENKYQEYIDDIKRRTK